MATAKPKPNNQIGNFTVFPTVETVNLDMAIWHNDVYGAGGIVAGVRDVLSGKVKVARFVRAAHPAQGGTVDGVFTIGIADIGWGNEVRFCGGDRGDEPAGANSYALMSCGHPEALSEAQVAAQLVAHIWGGMTPQYGYVWRVVV